jgi:hypothetical protein
MRFDFVLVWFARGSGACFSKLRGCPMSAGHRNGLRGHGWRPRAAGVGVDHFLVVSTQPVPTSSLRDNIGHPRMS